MNLTGDTEDFHVASLISQHINSDESRTTLGFQKQNTLLSLSNLTLRTVSHTNQHNLVKDEAGVPQYSERGLSLSPYRY